MFVGPKQTDEGELKFFLPRMMASSENLLGSSTDSEEAWTGTFIPCDVYCTYDMLQTRFDQEPRLVAVALVVRVHHGTPDLLVAEKRTDT